MKTFIEDNLLNKSGKLNVQWFFKNGFEKEYDSIIASYSNFRKSIAWGKITNHVSSTIIKHL